jgi:hypothetical protein
VSIPTTAPDMEALLIVGLSSVEETVNLKPERVNPYRLLVIRADLQQKVTPISRYCRVGISAWSVRADGSADIGDAFDLASEANTWLEANVSGPILSADVESGPSRTTDPITKLEFSYSTVLLEVAV